MADMRNLINIVEESKEQLDEGYVEFMFEAPADDIMSDLHGTQYSDVIRKSGNTVAILVPMSDRKVAIDDLVELLPGAEYDPSMPGSSNGGIRYRDGKVLIKPAGKQGAQSAGVANEIELFNIIQEMVATHKSITVTFKAHDGKKFDISGVIGIEHTGKETKGRLKGDVRIVTKDTKYPISLKKIDAEVWESADTYFGPTAIKILNRLYARNKIGLTGLGKKNQDGTEYVRISPEVAVEPTLDEVRNVIFGDDIETLKGAVIFQTFTPQHFVRDDDKLSVECESIIRSLNDIPRSHLMVWLIRNDSTRNPTGGIPGLRITAAVQTRAFGANGTKENILYVSRTGKELENPMADIAAQYIAAKGKKQAEQLKKLAATQKTKKKIDNVLNPHVDIRPPGTKKAPREIAAPRAKR